MPIREPGLGTAVKSFFKREHREVEVVKEITFEVAAGEVVGFLGPKGAGKTTTRKMFLGLLNPSPGSIRVFDRELLRRQRDFLRQSTLVMGNHNLLVWDTPVANSFEHNCTIYRFETIKFASTVADHDLSGLAAPDPDLRRAGCLRHHCAVRGAGETGRRQTDEDDGVALAVAMTAASRLL